MTETVYAKVYEGYSVNSSRSVMSGVVTEPAQQENGEVRYLVLKVYYDRQQTNVPQEPDHKTGSLTVSEKVSGKGGDTSYAFTFTVDLGDDSVNGTYADMYFENGTAVFTLRHGESMTAAGLPAGTAYTVRESDNEGYTVIKSGDTGVIPADGTADVLFENHKDREEEDQTDSESDNHKEDDGSNGGHRGGNGKGDGDDGKEQTGSTAEKDPAPGASALGVKTGDDTNMTLWFLLLSISGLILLGLSVYFGLCRKETIQKYKKHR